MQQRWQSGSDPWKAGALHGKFGRLLTGFVDRGTGIPRAAGPVEVVISSWFVVSRSSESGNFWVGVSEQWILNGFFVRIRRRRATIY